MFQKASYILAYAATISVAVFTVLSLFGRYLYFELTTHFRLQYLLVLIACAVFFGISKDWRFLALCLLFAAFNGAYVFPQYFSENYRSKNSPARDLSLMLANVEGKNREYDKLLESVKNADPDIVVLQEITEDWWQQIEPLTSDYPHFKAVPRPGGSGLVVLSRFALLQTEVLQLDESTHPALLSRIALNDTTLTLLTIHPPTPVRGDKFTNRNKQFSESAALMKAAPDPKIMIGDLNTTVWSPYFTGLVTNSGLRSVRQGKGLYPSWPSYLPNFMRIPIDHCLIGAGIEVVSVELGNYTGSDHFPLIVNLKVEKID